MDNNLKRIRRSAPSLLKITFPVVVGCIIATIIYYYVPFFVFLKENGDAISALSEILTVLGFFTAISLAYVKFFAGKLFAKRVQVSVECSIARISALSNMHLVKLLIHNPGNISSYIDSIRLNYTTFDEHSSAVSQSTDNFKCISDFVVGSKVLRVDPGLTTTIHMLLNAPVKNRATMYEAVITDTSGGLWIASKLVENR